MKLTTGDRIRVVEMPEEPDPLAEPATGIITAVNEHGDWVQYLVDWDAPNEHRMLMPACPPDRLEKI